MNFKKYITIFLLGCFSFLALFSLSGNPVETAEKAVSPIAKEVVKKVADLATIKKAAGIAIKAMEKKVAEETAKNPVSWLTWLENKTAISPIAFCRKTYTSLKEHPLAFGLPSAVTVLGGLGYLIWRDMHAPYLQEVWRIIENHHNGQGNKAIVCPCTGKDPKGTCKEQALKILIEQYRTPFWFRDTYLMDLVRGYFGEYGYNTSNCYSIINAYIHPGYLAWIPSLFYSKYR